MKYALILDNKVVDIAQKPFPVPPVATWIEFDETKTQVKVGDNYKDGVFSITPIPPEVLKQQQIVAKQRTLADTEDHLMAHFEEVVIQDKNFQTPEIMNVIALRKQTRKELKELRDKP